MGELIDGVWYRGDVSSLIKDGELKRKPSVFRNWIQTGSDARFKPEAGRYHLYVSLACPWAQRTLIMRALKGLESAIDISVTHFLMGEDGWSFAPGEGVIEDTVNHKTHMHEIYTLADPHCTTRVTVPVLWDKAEAAIVSNESAEIIRMFNSAFDDFAPNKADYYPTALRADIDAVNDRVYETLNNGVYRAGFATTQEAYESAVNQVFETLDWLEARLQAQPFVAGDDLTEADIRLFPTLARFDAVYHGHFKCNRKTIAEYPAIWAYLRGLYKRPAFQSTVNLTHIKQHYYRSHPWLNPSGVVAIGPERDFRKPD